MSAPQAPEVHSASLLAQIPNPPTKASLGGVRSPELAKSRTSNPRSTNPQSAQAFAIGAREPWTDIEQGPATRRAHRNDWMNDRTDDGDVMKPPLFGAHARGEHSEGTAG
eukprot:13199969-Alexandrium_andersonii.AAC.1